MTERILPMLAVAGEPQDSPGKVYELKWDGVRALAETNVRGWQAWGREAAEYTTRYPELEALSRLPAGTVLDGELVVLRQGRAHFPAILQRHGLANADRIVRAGRLDPVTYVAFDLLRLRGKSVCSCPLADRRRWLADLLADYPNPRLVLSEGVTSGGQEFFTAAVAQGHEGIMAKELRSQYLPGRRSRAWQKIKPAHCVPAVIIGYRPAGNTFGCLLVAAQQRGTLRYVGRLTSGFSDRVKDELGPLLARRVRRKPVVTCPQAVWVEPDLYCRVRFLQVTPSGRLRGATFAGLLAPT
jgi:bifunctional non-homologous end joining protein LigD